MVPLFLRIFAFAFLLVGGAALYWPPALVGLALLVPLFALGLHDALQTRRAVLRNFPLIGHFRYLLEAIRPEISQYFIESNIDGTPFNRELRSVVYQRSKRETQTLPFGTQRDVYEPGYEWIDHSLAARRPSDEAPRVTIGGSRCTRPYSASLLNVSAMSYGALSSNAVRALCGGARSGGFAVNTGEGGLSPYHLEAGCDLVWQIGTGYHGCRTLEGAFAPDEFARRAVDERVVMIELKLSQGAKPGHGGMLPAGKVTPEVAAIRGVPPGVDVLSPPAHSAFDSPRGLLVFLERLRELSGGKPVGFKLCVGRASEFLGICMAMRETGLGPDFITVDGGEGGTGAAPLEFSNSVGAPLTEGLVFVHNALTGFGLRERVRLIASGKIVTGFGVAARLAAGADLCSAARGFMFALGCIQARRCNSNVCPVGVATQDPKLTRGLVVVDKAERVASFHAETLRAFAELLGAAGLDEAHELRPDQVHRRISRTEVHTYAEIYRSLAPGSLLQPPYPEELAEAMRWASPDSFHPRRIALVG